MSESRLTQQQQQRQLRVDAAQVARIAREMTQRLRVPAPVLTDDPDERRRLARALRLEARRWHAPEDAP